MIRVAATSAFFLFLLLLLHQSSSPAAMVAAAHHHHHHHHHHHRCRHRHPNIIRKTCKQIADGDPNINYTFCLDSLRAVPKSRRADLRGLAVVSLKLAKTEAKRDKVRAKALLAEATGEHGGRYERSCLETCLELYAGAAGGLGDALREVRAGRYGDANVYASGAADAPSDCEGGFEEGGVASPLRKENQRLFQLAVIGLAITSRLG